MSAMFHRCAPGRGSAETYTILGGCRFKWARVACTEPRLVNPDDDGVATSLFYSRVLSSELCLFCPDHMPDSVVESRRRNIPIHYDGVGFQGHQESVVIIGGARCGF